MEQLNFHMLDSEVAQTDHEHNARVSSRHVKHATNRMHVSTQAAEETGFVSKKRAPLPTGSVTSITVSDAGAIQPYHLLPMLARCSHKSRWLMWLSPHRPLNKQWLATQGLEESPVVHIDLCEETQLYLCERILESGNSHMIIEWQGKIGAEQQSRIRSLAENTGTHVVLILRESN